MPPGLVYESESGQVSGTVSKDADVRDYTVTISADDGVNPAVSTPFTIAITPNPPPTISTPNGASFYRGESISAFTIAVLDEEDDPKVTVSGLPPGLVYKSGQVSGTVSSDADVRNYTVTITANDGVNPAVSDTFTVTVANPTPAQLAKLVEDSVVRVTAGRSGGSGFIFDTQGTTAFVVTAHHVIEDDEDDMDVRVNNLWTYEAVLLGYDSTNDVAVLSICCSPDFKALDWSADVSYEVGDQVVAVGYPSGSPGRATATIGRVTSSFWVRLRARISHDAPLNYGSSGSPLFSMDGRVLGINTAVSRVRDNIGYAVPYSTIAGKVADWKSRLVVTPEPTPEPSSPTPACHTGSLGRRECPLPFGMPVEIKFRGDRKDHWEITVIRSNPNATQTVLTHNRYNDPPKGGNRFFMATIRVKYLGPGSARFGGLDRLDGLGVGSVVYDGDRNECGRFPVIPNEFTDPELFTGGTIEGNVCWEIASSDADSLVMIVDSKSYSNDDRAWFALRR